MTDESRLTTADIAAPSEVERQDVEREGDGEIEDDVALEPLLAADEDEAFRSRWQSIQTAFVDAPQQSVEQADALVAELMQRLAQSFARERESLERQWSRGEQVSTEDLRVALKRYRSFFERLLTT